MFYKTNINDNENRTIKIIINCNDYISDSICKISKEISENNDYKKLLWTNSHKS